MPKFLAEDEVGFDTQTIGFPKLGGCMAAALLTDRGLYGFHITPGNVRKASLFKDFIASNGLQGTPCHLYGSCYWDNRYHGGNQERQWREEMQELAKKLGYTGIVTGFDTSSWISHADKRTNTTQYGKSHIGSNYVEYRWDGAAKSCRIFYKKMEKVDTTEGANDPNEPVKKITNVLRDPPKNQVTTSAKVKATPGNKGELHEAGHFGVHSFTIQ